MAYSSCEIQPWNNPGESQENIIGFYARQSLPSIQTAVTPEAGTASSSKREESTTKQKYTRNFLENKSKKNSKCAIVTDYLK